MFNTEPPAGTRAVPGGKCQIGLCGDGVVGKEREDLESFMCPLAT